MTRFPRWSGNASRQGSADILRRLIAYAEKVFGFSGTVVAGVADRRPRPRIPTAVIVKSVAVLFWSRMGSLNALELTARSSFFRQWLGESLCSADTVGRVNALMDAESLRQGLHHIYDRLKRNKALPDTNDSWKGRKGGSHAVLSPAGHHHAAARRATRLRTTAPASGS